jgi:hypothetical protein
MGESAERKNGGDCFRKKISVFIILPPQSPLRETLRGKQNSNYSPAFLCTNVYFTSPSGGRGVRVICLGEL